MTEEDAKGYALLYEVLLEMREKYYNYFFHEIVPLSYEGRMGLLEQYKVQLTMNGCSRKAVDFYAGQLEQALTSVPAELWRGFIARLARN